MKQSPLCRLCRCPRLQRRHQQPRRYPSWSFSQHSCHWSMLLYHRIRPDRPPYCPPGSWRMKQSPLCRLCRCPRLQRRHQQPRRYPSWSFSQHSCHWSMLLYHRIRPDRPPYCPPGSWRMKQYPLCRLCRCPRLQRPWHLPLTRRYPSNNYSQHSCHWSALLRRRIRPDRPP